MLKKTFGTKSVTFKLLVVSACAIATFLAVTFSIVIYKVRDRAIAMTLDQARTDAKATAETFAAKIANLSGATAFVTGSIEKGLHRKVLDRRGITAILPAMIEKSELVFGAWFMESALGLEERTEIVADENTGTNSSGLFIPYWQRADEGLKLLRPDIPDYSADYYRVSATTGKMTATEPYVEANAGNMLMMSITAPVRVTGELRGVLGIDIGLGALAKTLEMERPFGTGRVYLLSAKGKWLTAPRPELITKPYEEKGADKVELAVSSGEVVTIESVTGEEGTLTYRVVYPFDLPGLGTRWYLIEDVPVAAISAIVNEQTTILVSGSAAILLGVLIALYVAARIFIRDPINRLLQEVGGLSAGSYDKPVAGQERGDEIGALAVSLDAFRHRLAEGKELELAAVQQRSVVEAERALTEEQRTLAADRQKKIVDALGNGLSKLADGILSYRISQEFPSEYHGLRENFNLAAQSLQNTVARVQTTVDTLNDGTDEINRSAKQLSKRTEQQAANIEETAAALNDISQKLNESARDASLAAERVEAACSDADLTSGLVLEAVSAMERIEESSHKVAQIIGVIDQIAFQTNLLALNAGVEAARAGEAGKGFAVVAREVRELAQHSANAAKEIKTLISASGDMVQQGVSLVGETGDALGRIARQVVTVNELIQSISQSAKAQAFGLREINIAVSQMDQTTQQNAAMVEETTAASSILNHEASSLRDLIMEFELGDTAEGNSGRRAA